jgi:hypothetical protein
VAEESSFVEVIGRVRSGDESAARELVEWYEPHLRRVVRARLTDDEKQIADARARERGWAEIGVQMGIAPDTLRMRWTRTVDRLAQELGLVNSHD